MDFPYILGLFVSMLPPHTHSFLPLILVLEAAIGLVLRFFDFGSEISLVLRTTTAIGKPCTPESPYMDPPYNPEVPLLYVTTSGAPLGCSFGAPYGVSLVMQNSISVSSDMLY